jgi:hypothetical protein
MRKMKQGEAVRIVSDGREAVGTDCNEIENEVEQQTG